ncbi:Tyrosine N-monooxygenase [Dichanthelium oligosanthes]|uniref:Tyrosine N-monooxygenase n=1 Tax=Dichanthelium oligosanthes TaxID=888268 RepID=A0A1E5W4I4_9POAL|nr:Tyrosine N-monooxygenase [Dichanthelium oligosanthes]
MLAATAAAVVLVALVLLLLLVVFRRRSEAAVVTKGRLPPGPRGLPVLGNMHQMLANRPAVFRWLHRLLDDAGGGIVRVRLGPVHVVAVSCPEVAREVLRGRNDAVFADRPTTFAAESFSVGYRSASIAPFGDQWRKMRRVLTAEVLAPATEGRLRAVREGEADHLVRYVRALCRRDGPDCPGAVDVRHVARHFCGNVIRRLTLGRRHFARDEQPPADGVGGPGRDEVEHVDALFATLNYLDAFCVSDYFPALVGLDLDGHERVVRGVMRTLSRLHDPVVEARVEEWRLLRKAGERRDPADFLDVLASLDDAAGRPLLTVEEIKAQTIDIMIATVDNPSNAAEWALAEIMNRPGVMAKAVAELDAVVGRDRLVAERDVRGLNYLKACIREAFRLHPYHPFNPPRVAMADTAVAGYAIPKGSQVILSRVGLGRNPRVWEDPLEFRPERHLAGLGGAAGAAGSGVSLSEPELRFISFSTGRRGCPGLSLGTLITVMLLARLLQGFEWTTPTGVGTVDLREAAASLVLAEPLVLQATPRLPAHLYEAK